MKKVTDLNEYSHKADLELCLSMIEDAYADIQAGAHDLAEAQIKDILETFERENQAENAVTYANNVLEFGRDWKK
tara:strand:+ start:74 stop:298 length:225 start_codon:yes stop_codon:yes gene_type:complete